VSPFWYSVWLVAYSVAETVIYKIDWWVMALFGVTP
jgi:hypothetical protein